MPDRRLRALRPNRTAHQAGPRAPTGCPASTGFGRSPFSGCCSSTATSGRSGRISGRRRLLRDQWIPDHHAAAPRTRRNGPDRSPWLLAPPRAPTSARAVPRTGGGHCLRGHRRAGCPRPAPRGRPRGRRLRNQLVPRSLTISRTSRQSAAVPVPPPVVAGGRGTVLPALADRAGCGAVDRPSAWRIPADADRRRRSITWTSVLFDRESDPSRVYYGTDTRLFALLIGAALAFAATSRLQWRTYSRRSPVAQPRFRWPDLTAGAGLVLLAWAFVAVDLYDPFLYPWGSVAVALVAACVSRAPPTRAGTLGRMCLTSPHCAGSASAHTGLPLALAHLHAHATGP